MGYLVEDWIRDDIPKKIIQQKYNIANIAVDFNVHCNKIGASYTYGTSKAVFERAYFSRPNQPNMRVPGRSTIFTELVYTGAAAPPSTARTLGLHRIAPSAYGWQNVLTADFFPRLCPVMRNAREYVESTFPDGAIFLVNPRIQKSSGVELNGYAIERQLSKADFIASIPDEDEVVDHYEIYTDKADGSEQELLASYSLSVGKVLYDAYIPVPYSDYAGGNNVYILGYLQTALCEYYSNPGKAYNTSAFRAATLRAAADKSVSRLNSAISIDKNVEFTIRVCSNSSGQYQPRADFNDANFYGTVISGNKDQWKLFFDSSGFDWSFDKDIVISPKGDGIRKPITPGQPDNPTDDTPGDGDNSNDDVVYPEITYVPTTAIYSRYWLNQDEVNQLKTFLFSKTFIDNIERLWTNPAEYIIGLDYYPFEYTALDMGASSASIFIGNINTEIQSVALANSGTPFIYGGHVDITPYFNSYMDYAPYTSIDIYIPYIGIRQLNVEQVMGHRLDIGYVFDLNTRQFTAMLGIDGNMLLSETGLSHTGNLGKVITQYTGVMATQFSLGGTSANETALNAIQATTGIVTTAGALAVGIATANPVAIVGGATGLMNSLTNQQDMVIPRMYGTISPMTGIFAPQQPYLIINHPIPARPASWQTFHGYPAGYSGVVSDFSGFLQCLSIDLPATSTMTAEEQSEIENLMTGGIYCG